MRRIALAFGLALAAIGGISCAPQDTGFACPANAGPAVVDAPPRLVVPADGATGIPLAVGALLVTSPADGTFSLQSGATSLAIGPVSNVPSPVPSDVPTYDPASSFHDVGVPKLAPNTSYTLEYVPPHSNAPCGNGESGGPGGTFTTGAM